MYCLSSTLVSSYTPQIIGGSCHPWLHLGSKVLQLRTQGNSSSTMTKWCRGGAWVLASGNLLLSASETLGKFVLVSMCFKFLVYKIRVKSRMGLPILQNRSEDKIMKNNQRGERERGRWWWWGKCNEFL